MWGRTALMFATIVTGISVGAPAVAADATATAVRQQASAQEAAAEVASCSAVLTTASVWTGGFFGQVRVTNTGTVLINWRVTINFPGARVTPPPGYIVIQSGTSWLIYPPPESSWNGTLAPGAATLFGFSATTTGTITMPTLTCTATPV